MDLSKLKWPVIIVVVVGVGWLLTDPGISYMHKKFSQDPGEDAELAKSYEAGLTRLGLFLFRTFRYERAGVIIEDALERYPNGVNSAVNRYRLARIAEKMGQYQRASNILAKLIEDEAHKMLDDRVPDNDTLELRREKLVELHDLER